MPCLESDGTRGAAEHVAADSEAADRRLVYFGRLLAVGIFAHSYVWLAEQMTRAHGVAGYPEWYAWTPGLFLPWPVHLLVNWGLFLLATASLATGRRPLGSARVLFVLAVVHFLGMPERVSNHYFVILVAVGVLALAPRGPTGSPSPLPLAILRLLCAHTYFFAFLHKLNRNWFELETSPAWVIDSVLRSVGLHERYFHDPALFRLAATAPLVAELLIPVLLYMPRTRLAGFFAGLTFHAFLAIADAPDYTAVILAFYALFLGADQARVLAGKLSTPTLRTLLLSALLAAIGLRVSYVFSSRTLHEPQNLASLGLHALGLFAVLFGIGWVGLSAAGLIHARRLRPAMEPDREPWSRSQRAAFAGFAVFYTVNCMSPYIGLKYYFSQEMFSGLPVTGAGHHVFHPLGPDRVRSGYVRLEEIDFDAGAARRLLPRSRPLLALPAIRGRVVEANFLRSVLAHACREGALAPIAIRYQTSLATVALADVCLSDLSHHPFNLYPWVPSADQLTGFHGE